MVKYTPTILLHGALGTQKSFDKLISSSNNQSLYAFDFTGHGSKPTNTKLSFEQFADDIKTFVDFHDIRGCDVFGYSMGGYAALFTALKFPNVLGNIITLGTKMNWTPEIAAQEVKMLNPDKMLEKIPKYAEYLQSLHGSNWSYLVKQTADLMEDLGSGMALTESDFQQIKNQVVVGLGSMDKMVTVEESQWAVGQLPNASFHLLPDVEHPIEKVNLIEVLSTLKSKI